MKEDPREVNRGQAKKRADAETRDFLSKLTDAWDIDDDLEDIFWAYASKDIVLSNLNQFDIEKVMNGFRDTVNDYVIQQPEHEYTWEDEMAVGQFEDWLYVRLKRSLDGFERKMETTETSVQKQMIESFNREEEGGFSLGSLFGEEKEEERR